MLRKIMLLTVLSLFTLSVNAQSKHPRKKCRTKTVKKGVKNTADMKTATTKNTEQAGVIYLREGENIFLKDQQMNVTFKEVSEDSRCPEGVNCIWAGNAVAQVQMMGTYTRPVTLTLNTVQDENRGLYSTQDFNGYKVSLVSLTPNPTEAKGLKELKGSYKVGLKIEKGESQNPTIQRGGTTTK